MKARAMKKKIWFFVEGDTEENLIIYLTRKKFYRTILQEKDLGAFLDEDMQNSSYHKIYCENCRGVDKIPHRINEMFHFVEKSGSKDIFIVCDIEKLKCNTNRKKNIESKLEDAIDKHIIKYIFFNPMIEASYWNCPQTIKRIIEREYKRKFKTSDVPAISLPEKEEYSQHDLKKCFIGFNLKYRETSFSEIFFSTVDFEQCDNKVLKRLNNFLEPV